MANFYLRVPHYVAAYFRNRDPKNPIPIGGIIKIEKIDPLWHIIYNTSRSNTQDAIVPYGCFCERQWRRMMRGTPICKQKEREKNLTPIPAKESFETLSDTEISMLTGLPDRKGEDSGEYLCIKLPDIVIIDGYTYKTNGQWQPMEKAARQLAEMMIAEYWRVFDVYLSKDREFCMSNKIERPLLEVIDRFMSLYDIRNSSDDRERQTMKRNYYRRLKRMKFSSDDFVEHGSVV